MLSLDQPFATIIDVLLVFFLVFANGFFVAAEFSLVAVRSSRVAELVAQGRTNAGALQQDDGTLLVDGMMAVNEAFISLHITRRPEGDYHTIAGFAVFLLGKIPAVGDQFVWEGWRFEVTDMDRQRINKLRVSRRSE